VPALACTQRCAGLPIIRVIQRKSFKVPSLSRGRPGAVKYFAPGEAAMKLHRSGGGTCLNRCTRRSSCTSRGAISRCAFRGAANGTYY
jgi:hypothetical protein